MFQRSLKPHHLIPRPLWAIIILALLLRAAVMARGTDRFDDPDNYLPMARSLASGEGFALRGRPTAYRPPLYPLILAPLAAGRDAWIPWGIALLHLGLGAGTVGMAAVAAERFGLSRVRAMVAALIVACDPVLIVQCRSVMTETLAAFLVAATLAGLASGGHRGLFLGGLGFGLAGLCRPSLLAGAGLTALASLLVKPGDLRNASAEHGALPDRRPGPPALDDPEPRGLRRAGLDDDSRRLHAGPGEQPRVLPRCPQRRAWPGLDRARPMALVGFGQSRDPRHERATGRSLLEGRSGGWCKSVRTISAGLRWPGSVTSGMSAPAASVYPSVCPGHLRLDPSVVAGWGWGCCEGPSGSGPGSRRR